MRIKLEGDSGVEEHLLRMKFPVIDERREGQREGKQGNVAGLLFRLGGLQSAEELLELVRQVRAWLHVGSHIDSAGAGQIIPAGERAKLSDYL